MTNEEFRNAIEKLGNEWELTEKPKYFPGLLHTENNWNEIGAVIVRHVQLTGVMPHLRELTAFVKDLGDIENGGKLQFHHAQREAPPAPPPPSNPIDNLPHSDMKELKFLRTIEDVQRYQARVQRDGLDYMSGFKYLKAGSKPYEHINARIAFILNNEIHASDSPAPTPAQSKPVTNVPSGISDARKCVDAMTVADVGQTGSGMGRRQLLANKQRRLHYDINEMWGKGVKPGAILERTKEAIREFGQSSIR